MSLLTELRGEARVASDLVGKAMTELNSFPHESYLLLATVSAAVLLTGSFILRFGLGESVMSRYWLGAAVGIAAGFCLLTSPWLVDLVRSSKDWPILAFWPSWGGDSAGPFTASVLGSGADFVVGILVAMRRHHTAPPEA